MDFSHDHPKWDTAQPRQGPADALAPGQRWYCAQTQPRREILASRHLAAQGFRAFLPQIAKTVRHARKVQTVRAALFPRYLFVALDPDQDRWRPVNGTIGVSRLLTANGFPTAVPDGVVEALLACQDPAGTVRFSFEEGQAVRVVAGPFSDMIGLIERLDGNGRVRVLLDIMGGTVPTALTAAYLAPAA